jgi:hypothetical protein
MKNSVVVIGLYEYTRTDNGFMYDKRNVFDVRGILGSINPYENTARRKRTK